MAFSFNLPRVMLFLLYVLLCLGPSVVGKVQFAVRNFPHYLENYCLMCAGRQYCRIWFRLQYRCEFVPSRQELHDTQHVPGLLQHFDSVSAIEVTRRPRWRRADETFRGWWRIEYVQTASVTFLVIHDSNTDPRSGWMAISRQQRTRRKSRRLELRNVRQVGTSMSIHRSILRYRRAQLCSI